MTHTAISRFEKLAMRLALVSFGCVLLVVAERFAYNVLDIGRNFHRSLLGYLWLFIMPWVGYWAVLQSSPLLVGWKRQRRVLTFGFVAFLFALVFGFVATVVLYEIAWSYGLQFF